MAVDIAEDRGLRLPNPPPLLHTRSGNDAFDRPSTPADNGFTSPPQTPQGSPSKTRMPPGALDLPNVFDKAMKLTPTSPSKSTYNHYNHPMFTLDKNSGIEDFNESVIHQRPTSPTRKANKENTPPSTRIPKDLGPNPTAAAISRHEPYQQRDTDTSKRQVQLRGLTPEELEKLQQPRVKRLVNVTQLCKLSGKYLRVLMLTLRRLPRPLLRPPQLRPQPPKPPQPIQVRLSRPACHTSRRIRARAAQVPRARTGAPAQASHASAPA